MDDPDDGSVPGWLIVLGWVVALILVWGLLFAVVSRVLG
jgi:hypothetical protein